MEENVEVEVKSHKLLNFFIAFVIIIVTVFLYAKYIETKMFEIKEYRVESNILSSNFDGIKIVHFSDLLYKSTVDKDDVKKIVNRINELNPDIVVFTGNLVSNGVKITTEDTNMLVSELSKIHATIDKYAIYGENDFIFKDYELIMKNSNFKILNNTFDEVYYKDNNPLYIVGLPSVKKGSVNLDEAFKFYEDNDRKYIIVLVSEGKTIKYLDESLYEVDLILGGYSLNGSVVLPVYGSVYKDSYYYKYYNPEYKKGITNIYISSGIGTRKSGLRFLNKPSVNFYRLKAQN